MSHFNEYQKMTVLKYLEMKSLKKENLFVFDLCKGAA